QRYRDDAETDLRRLAARHEESDERTLAERLSALRRLARNPDLLAECFDLHLDLVKVVSAIAYALLIGKHAPQGKDERERQLALGKNRIARMRAKTRGDRSQPPILTIIRKGLERPAALSTPLLWAHAGLYQYMVREQGYRPANRRRRQRLDALMQ